MFLANNLSILLVSHLSLICLSEGFIAKCGMPDLMKYGAAAQKKAIEVCTNSGGHPDKELLAKAQKCMYEEIEKAHPDYKKHLEMVAHKCINDGMLSDPCNPMIITKFIKCGQKLLKDQPNLKKEGMICFDKHCQKIVNHIKDLFSCSGQPLKVGMI